MSAAPGALAAEEQRIAAVYGRRAGAAARYSVFEPGHLFTLQQLERRMLRALREAGGIEGKRILEVGCGTGYWLRQLLQWGAPPEALAGIELLPDRVARARQLCPGGVDLRQGSAAALPFADSSFDIVLQATLFTSILDPQLRERVAAEMRRVLKNGGTILWYDFRFDNPRNPEVRGIERDEIRRLFSGSAIALERITLAPPIARRLAPYTYIGCCLLEKLPWLCTHYLGVIRKAPGGP